MKVNKRRNLYVFITVHFYVSVNKIPTEGTQIYL